VERLMGEGKFEAQDADELSLPQIRNLKTIKIWYQEYNFRRISKTLGHVYAHKPYCN
jgi:hypothetical protein